MDYECLADFLPSNELYFIETLTGIAQKMKKFHFPVKSPWLLSEAGQ